MIEVRTPVTAADPLKPASNRDPTYFPRVFITSPDFTLG